MTCKLVIARIELDARPEQSRSLQFAPPDFPVEVGGFGELHAPFSTEGAYADFYDAARQEIRVRCGRKTFPGMVRRTADPSATLLMNKGAGLLSRP